MNNNKVNMRNKIIKLIGLVAVASSVLLGCDSERRPLTTSDCKHGWENWSKPDYDRIFPDQTRRCTNCNLVVKRYISD